ncbi:MAG: restriction endonuclease subunit S, partial [Candidatus Paceibacterota bacterium]
SEWKEYKFSDFVSINPTIKMPTNEPISFVEMKDLVDGKKYCYPSSTRLKGGGAKFENRDTLFARITPCLENGKICQVMGLKNGVGFGSTEFLVFRGKSKVSDSDFVFYLSRWSEVRSHAEINLDGTSGRQRVPKDCFNELILNLPESVLEQTAIASVLSSLDDKIDLLHRQNATLEKIAETLFRQWFVEEAKEEWKEGKLSELVIVKYGKDHKKLLDGEIPVFGSGGLMRHVEKSLYNKESVLIPRKGSLNNVMYQDEPFWTVDTMFYTEMKIPNVAKFIYHFLKEQDLASMNVGSAVPSMTTEILNNMPLDIPPIEVFEKFEGAVAPLYAKTKSNQTQINTLSALRDTLLPKLMSGEIRIEKMELI